MYHSDQVIAVILATGIILLAWAMTQIGGG